MDRDLKKKYTITLVVAILCLVVIVFSSSYAYFKTRISGEGSKIDIAGGTFKLSISESKITASGLAPIYDTQKSTKASKNDFTISLSGLGISEACYDLYLELDTIGSNLQNKYLKYELTSGRNTYTGTFEARTSGTRIALLKDVTITSSNSYTLRIWLSYDETEDQTSILTGEASTRSLTAHLRAVGTSGECKLPTLKEAILEDNIVSSRTDFSTYNTSNTTGIVYSTNKTEDGSEVYYYSGNTTNNWVKFGGFYWRIIRTNEDGSVRLLYAGTSHDTTEAYIGSLDFNEISSQNALGYMYGENTSLETARLNTTSSNIKNFIDTWYQDYLLTNYDKYISKSAIYCNDRSITEGSWSDYGFLNIFYERVNGDVVAPSYKCGVDESGGLFESTQAVEDKFSASTTGGGNGQLTYPIALMTADETVFAGAKRSSRSDDILTAPYAWYYLNSNGESIVGYYTEWYTMSPAMYDSGPYWLSILGSYSPGKLVENRYSGTVRPALSIDPCAKVTGTGTVADPYIIDESASTC